MLHITLLPPDIFSINISYFPIVFVQPLQPTTCLYFSSFWLCALCIVIIIWHVHIIYFFNLLYLNMLWCLISLHNIICNGYIIVHKVGMSVYCSTTRYIVSSFFAFLNNAVINIFIFIPFVCIWEYFLS